MRIASMAYLPRRNHKKAKHSILNQVDCFVEKRGTNELGDANKFWGLVEQEGYLFTIDDDIAYPPDYVDYMIEKIEQYHRKAVITMHGKIIKDQPIDSFYGRDFMKFRCLDEVRRDVPVHIPGTGCMGWHSDTIQFRMDDFPKKNMADIWAGIKCEKENVPRVCVAHEKGWLKNLNTEDKTLWVKNKQRDKVLTDAINSIEWELLIKKQ